MCLDSPGDTLVDVVKTMGYLSLLCSTAEDRESHCCQMELDASTVKLESLAWAIYTHPRWAVTIVDYL